MTDPDDKAFTSSEYGLTKREYFAAMAMEGLLSDFKNAKNDEMLIEAFAVRLADALIEELNK